MRPECHSFRRRRRRPSALLGWSGEGTVVARRLHARCKKLARLGGFMTTSPRPRPGALPIRRPGDVLVEGIALVEPIGNGGMGEVWRARHARLDTDVAVKLIRADALTAPTRQRFELEARAAARIKSPHVVRVFDHGETAAGEPYIVMELLEGESLGQRLDR